MISSFSPQKHGKILRNKENQNDKNKAFKLIVAGEKIHCISGDMAMDIPFMADSDDIRGGNASGYACIR